MPKGQGTLGQPTPVGSGESENYGLDAGFWNNADVATGVLEDLLPEAFRNLLFGNVPNPFNPVTTIRYEVGAPVPVEITIYDIRGRLVRTLVDESQATGRYEAIWEGRDDSGRSVSSGVYLYQIRIGSYGAVKKMVLVK